MKMKQTSENSSNTSPSYGFWQSPLSLEQLFAKQDSVAYPTLHQENYFYLSTLSEQKGRQVLMQLQPGKTAQCITPAPYNLRTRISEYGGKPYCLSDQAIYFVNQTDQHIYRQSLYSDGEVQPLSNQPQCITPSLPDKHKAMFADMQIVNEQLLLAVMESADDSELENTMSLVALTHSADSTHSNAGAQGSAKVLVEGADFYSNLVLNKAQNKIAWVQWQHPSMPWDDCELWVADLLVQNNQVQLTEAKQISLPADSSVCQLAFANNGDLYFSMDTAKQTRQSEDVWNVYCVDLKQPGTIVPISQLNEEFGYPHWQYGDHRITTLDEFRMAVIGSSPTQDNLYVIDTSDRTINQVNLGFDYVGLNSLSSNQQGELVCLITYSDAQPSLHRLDLTGTTAVGSLIKQTSSPLLGSEVSIAQHISYKTRDGQQAYGFLYLPQTKLETAPEVLPPLIVMVHGGPTARSYGHFDLQKQFWTSRGFAVFDVNHRGSSGYGRTFRDELYGQWGVMDINDVVDGIHFLIDQNQVDPNKIAIRGKSAGGYAVLRALTEYPSLFKAGACYYGIGNLLTLAEHTHKFEKHYTDRLIGEKFDAKQARETQSLYYQRSPIHFVANIQSAMIVFQGLDDKVVPPCVAQEIVKALKDNQVSHNYIEYPGEGHGFRQTETNIDAWSKELAFYQKVLV